MPSELHTIHQFLWSTRLKAAACACDVYISPTYYQTIPSFSSLHSSLCILSSKFSFKNSSVFPPSNCFTSQFMATICSQNGTCSYKPPSFINYFFHKPLIFYKPFFSQTTFFLYTILFRKLPMYSYNIIVHARRVSFS